MFCQDGSSTKAKLVEIWNTYRYIYASHKSKLEGLTIHHQSRSFGMYFFVPSFSQNETYNLASNPEVHGHKHLQTLEWLNHCQRKFVTSHDQLVDVVHQLHDFHPWGCSSCHNFESLSLGHANPVRQWNSVKVGVSRSYAEQFACCILPLPQCQHAKCFGRWDQSLIRWRHGFASWLDVCKLHLKSVQRFSCR